MKKKLMDVFRRNPMAQKILLAMRLTLFLMVLSVFSAYSSSYAQKTKLNLKVQNTQVKEVLNQIENQSEFFFMFDNKQVDVERKVNLEVSSMNIDQVLQKLFEGTGVNFRIINRQILLFSENTNSAFSQQANRVSGKVTDSAGESLPGVSVVVKGTTNGTITDGNGNYSLPNIPENATLQFSFVGMKGQEVTVGGKTTINVTLAEDAIGIEEVVAVGYGTTKKVNLTGAVGSINNSTIEKIPAIASTNNALAGRLPGLISKQYSGSPGRDASSLSIRGFGDALVIVDGVESQFNNIDPNQIESISILKDASSAIYGARAGNGVILVTTKRGNVEKPTISFNGTYSSQSITDYPDMMSSGQYSEYQREYYLNQGLDPNTEGFSKENIQKYYDGTDPDYPNTDWRSLLLKDNAPMQMYDVSIRGGSDKIKYFGSIGYLDQQSLWKESGGAMNRYNFRANIDAKITNNLSAQMDFSDILEFRTSSAREHDATSNVETWLWQDLWGTLPTYPSSLPDPSKIAFGGGGATGGANISSNRNIFGAADDQNEHIKIAGGFQYKMPFVKGLTAKYLLTYNKSYGKFKVMQRPVEFWEYNYSMDLYTQVGQWSPDSKLYQSSSENRVLTNQFSLNYESIFNDVHQIQAMALFESIDYSYEWISGERQKFLTPDIPYLDAGGDYEKASGSASEMGRMSYVGRLNYIYKDKFLAELIFRADASAKFQKESRWGYFPSLSIGWRVSEENFVKDNLPAIDNLKVRASVGQMGYDNVANYDYLAGYIIPKYTSGPWNPDKNVMYVFGADGAMNGIVATSLANPYLSWEEMTIYNAGIDYSFLNSKIYGEFDAFYRTRDGIPATKLQSLPSTFGASLPVENLNSQNNRGFELVLGSKQKYGDFLLDISGNISWSRAKWGHYEEPDYSDDDYSDEAKRVKQISGQWVDRQMGYLTDGLYTSQDQINAMTFDQDNQGNITLKPGDIKYIDKNNDGVLDWKDQTEIGKGSIPHWMFGLATNFTYKNFDLDMLFQGATGYNVVPSLASTAEVLFTKGWSPERNNDANALFPRTGSTAQGGGVSDFNLKEAGYIRLKTVNLGYNLPSNILQKAHIQNLRIYIAGTNLLTYNKLKEFGYDPEIGSGYYNYPIMRTLTFGINLKL
jgi:TonB-linked SusC/RagA family outer membrane protein